MKNNGNNMHWANLEVFSKNDVKLLTIVGQNCLMRLKQEDWNGSNYVLFYIAVDEIYNPYNKIMSDQEYLEWYIEFLTSIGFKCNFEGIRVVADYRNETDKSMVNRKNVECFTIKIDQADFKGNRWTFFATWQSIRYIYSFYNTKTVETMYMLQKRFGSVLSNEVIYQIAHYIIPRLNVNNTWSVIPRMCFSISDQNQPVNHWGNYPVIHKECVYRLKTKDIFIKDTTLGVLQSVSQMFNAYNGIIRVQAPYVYDKKRNLYVNIQEGVIADFEKDRGALVRNLIMKIKKSVRDRTDCINEILDLLEYPGAKVEKTPIVKKVKRKKYVAEKVA